MPSDKAALQRELVAELTTALELAHAAHAAAVAGATDAEAQAENDKDTRGLEQSYLARGQAQRVVELEAALADVSALVLRAFTAQDRIAIGALVELESEDESDDAEPGQDATRTVFLAPGGGGAVLTGHVRVVTPSSPLGRALLAKRAGDEMVLRLPGGVRRFVIAAVQ